MKKTLIMLAAAAIVLVGCEEKGPATVQSISIFPAELTLTEADSLGKALTLGYEPATAPAPTNVTWESSDPSIVAIDADGKVYPVAEGQVTITATFNELKATAIVTVSGALDLFELGICDLVGGMSKDDPVVSEDIIQIESTSGAVYNCNVCRWTCIFCGSGLSYTQGVGISGADYMIYAIDVPLYTIVDGPSAGGCFGAEVKFTSDPSYADSIGYALVGNFDETKIDAAGVFASWLYQLPGGAEISDDEGLAAYEEYNKAFTGAYAIYMDYDDPEFSGGYLLDGIVTGGRIYDETDYELDMRWFTGFYGLKINAEGTDLVRPYEYSFIDKHYKKLPAEDEAAAPRVLRKPTTIKMPEIDLSKITPTMKAKALALKK